MSFEFRDATRQGTNVLIGLAGGTGSGKTESSMKLATGISGGKKFAVIDTEAGRALHKADDYDFDHGDLTAPFTPERYAEAIAAADAAGYPVIVVDSASHEYEGVGGVLEMQEEELARLMRGDESRREAVRGSSWIAPKRRHKKAFVQPLLQVRAHVILCFRAEDKIEFVKENGKTVVRAKQTLTGLDGWVPICERRLPFELTLSFLLTADRPGYPKPIKLEERHRAFFPLDKPISEETGVQLAAWAAGGATASPVPVLPVEQGKPSESEALVKELREFAEAQGSLETTDAAIEKNLGFDDPAGHLMWLRSQVERVRAAEKATA
jgi:hypothetical protein